MTESVEQMIKRINKRDDVLGLIVMNQEGIPIKSTLDRSLTAQYSSQTNQLVQLSKTCIRNLDPQNRLTVLRIRTKTHELMTVVDTDYMLLVVQDVEVKKDNDKEKESRGR